MRVLASPIVGPAGADGQQGQQGPPGPSGGGGSMIAIDAYTLHQWLLNDPPAQGWFADHGTAGANGSLFPSNPTFIYPGEVGLYCDATSVQPNGFLRSSNSSAAPGNTPTSTTLISVHGWYRPRSLPRAWARLCGRSWSAPINDYQTDAFTILNKDTTGFLYVMWANSVPLEQKQTVQSLRPITFGDWHHVGATFSQAAGTATIRLYIDGAPDLVATLASGPLSWNNAGAGSWYVGGMNAGSATNTINDATFCDWRVDDGIARSDAYFKALYRAGVGASY